MGLISRRQPEPVPPPAVEPEPLDPVTLRIQNRINALPLHEAKRWVGQLIYQTGEALDALGNPDHEMGPVAPDELRASLHSLYAAGTALLTKFDRRDI